jgi:EmrB/QacA subfamily drug resistance transporter
LPSRSRSRPLALAAICVVVFLTFLDTTVVSVGLKGVQDDLKSGVTALQWVVNGYALAFAGLMLVGGSLGDLFGRRKVMLVGVVIFCAGSVLSAVASSAAALIVGRVVMGVGAAASEPGTLSMLRQLFPGERSRARALGAWTAVSGLALALGPVIGGLLVQLGSWRTIFWFNLVFGALALVLAAATLPEAADREGRRIDVLGAVLGAAAIGTLTYGIIQGERDGYTSTTILVLFAVAAVALLAFVVTEYLMTDPLVDLSFFRQPTFAGANLVAFLAYFGLFAIFFFTALYLQIVVGQSASELAVQFAPMAAGMVLAAALTGRWAGAMGPKVPMTVGCLIAAAGILWTDSTIKPDAGYLPLGFALLVAGVGFGITLVPVTAAAMAAVPARRSGMAAGVTNTSRQLGAVVGIAVLGSVINGALTGKLQERLQSLGIPQVLQTYVANVVAHGGVPSKGSVSDYPPVLRPIVQKVLDAAYASFGEGLHSCLRLAAILLVAGALTALLLVRHGTLPTTEDEPSAL